MPHSLNCTCYICYICYWLLLWLPVKKSVFKNGTSAEAPSLSCSCCPLRPSLPAAAGRTPRGRSMLQDAAESDLSTGGVALAARGALWPAAIAELPGRGRRGRPRRRPSPRGTPRPPGGRWLLPSAALTGPTNPVGRGCRGRGAGGPGRPGGRRWAPRRRCRCLGARRNETEMTMFFFLFFLFDLFHFSYLQVCYVCYYWNSIESVRDLNLLNFEVPDVHVMELEVQLQVYFYRSFAWGSIKFYL